MPHTGRLRRATTTHAAELEPEDDARRAELARWADDDTGTEDADEHTADQADDEAFGR